MMDKTDQTKTARACVGEIGNREIVKLLAADSKIDQDQSLQQ